MPVFSNLSDVMLVFSTLSGVTLWFQLYFVPVDSYANGLKISFANCIYGLANELDPNIDAQKVLYLVSTTAECFLSRKYGLRVGAPYGGVCLPKDVPELTSLAPDGSVFREFLSGTGKINDWIANTPNLKVETSTVVRVVQGLCLSIIIARFQPRLDVDRLVLAWIQHIIVGNEQISFPCLPLLLLLQCKILYSD